MHVRTNIWTREHARGQTDRRTDGRKDGLKHTPSRTRACKHTNACIDKHMYVRSNIWTHEHGRGQTDKRTDSHIRPHARAHAHKRTLACLHVYTMHSGTYARTDRHTHACSYGGKLTSTNIEVRFPPFRLQTTRCRRPRKRKGRWSFIFLARCINNHTSQLTLFYYSSSNDLA